MKNTFVCDESMIITIPVGSIQELQDGQLMPEQFYCVFNDHFKVLVIKGKAQPLGVSSTVTTEEMASQTDKLCFFSAKLSFSLNILSLFWSITAFVMNLILLISRFPPYSEYPYYWGYPPYWVCHNTLYRITLLVVEFFICIFLIYWLSKAICRQHFNTLVGISFYASVLLQSYSCKEL
uniref:Uncharacterized protein n=1 Tax=Oryzias melastigma TaxID=30732 RepID=A0A3B3CQJ0_ORYME